MTTHSVLKLKAKQHLYQRTTQYDISSKNKLSEIKVLLPVAEVISSTDGVCSALCLNCVSFICKGACIKSIIIGP